ncbi:MAG: hypothetical protein ACK5XN_27095 [Bacteroidota bacterium]|jgi:DNA-binding XRE family transcriptional regulator
MAGINFIENEQYLPKLKFRNKMKTAVQKLAEQMEHPNIFNPFIAEALEVEKQQIIDAVNSHDKDCIRTTNNVICKLKPSCKMLFEYDGKAGVEYYNKTFM